jgi:hypothetical protein
MKAKFSSRCAGCGSPINEGDNISRGPSGKFEHSSCSRGRLTGGGNVFPTMDEADYHEMRRDEAEYQKGYHEVASIQAFFPPGPMRDAAYMEMEMAAYNRGEDY